MIERVRKSKKRKVFDIQHFTVFLSIVELFILIFVLLISNDFRVFLSPKYIAGKWPMKGCSLANTNEAEYGSGLRTDNIGVKWERNISKFITSCGPFNVSEILASNNSIILSVITDENKNQGYYYLLCFNAYSGLFQWEYSVGSDLLKSVTIYNSNIFFIHSDKNDNYYLSFVDITTGSRIKKIEINNCIPSLIFISNEYLYLLSEDSSNNDSFIYQYSLDYILYNDTPTLKNYMNKASIDGRIGEFGGGLCSSNKNIYVLTYYKSFVYLNIINIYNFSIRHSIRIKDDLGNSKIKSPSVIRDIYGNENIFCTINDTIQIHYFINQHTIIHKQFIKSDSEIIAQPAINDNHVIFLTDKGYYSARHTYQRIQWQKKWNSTVIQKITRSAPVISENQVLIANIAGIESVDINNGELIWSYKWKKEELPYDSVTLTSPIVYNHSVYASFGDILYCLSDNKQ